MRLQPAGITCAHIATMRSIARGLAPYIRLLTHEYPNAAQCKFATQPVLRQLEAHVGCFEFEGPDTCWVLFNVGHVQAHLVVRAKARTLQVSLTMEKRDVRLPETQNPEDQTGWGIV